MWECIFRVISYRYLGTEKFLNADCGSANTAQDIYRQDQQTVFKAGSRQKQATPNRGDWRSVEEASSSGRPTTDYDDDDEDVTCEGN